MCVQLFHMVSIDVPAGVSNYANSNYSKGIWMQILTIRKGFEAYSNANSNQLKGIRSIRMQI